MPQKPTCVVPNCGITQISHPAIRFSKYPEFRSDKFYEWNEILGLQLGRGVFYICQKHFTDECFGASSKRLNNRAKPSLYLGNDTESNSPLKLLKPHKTYSNKRKYGDNSSNLKRQLEPEFLLPTSTPDLDLNNIKKTYPGPKTFSNQIEPLICKIDEWALLKTPEKTQRCSTSQSDALPIYLCSYCEKEKKKSYYWWKKYHKLKSVLKQNKQIKVQNKKKTNYLKKQKKIIKYAETMKAISNLNHVEKNPKSFCTMVLQKRTIRQVWLTSERELCMALFFKSPAYYMFFKDLGFRLPAYSTLNTWLPVKTLGFGIHDESFVKLETYLKESNNKMDNECVLVFDEIHIKPSLDYNRPNDYVDGLCTDGTNRSNIIGKEVCVFMIRGLLSSYNFIVGHVISNTAIKSNLLEVHVKNIIQKCVSKTINIRAIVCDQGSNNRALFKNLGITKDNPYFVHEHLTILGFFCTPHLLKSVRNIMMSSKLKTSDGIINFDFVKMVYNIDKNKSTKICPKLTINHIDPNNFAKMRVCYAAQVLSNSVASAINLCLHLNYIQQEDTNSAKATELFLKKFNDIFDFFNTNSKGPPVNGYFISRNGLDYNEFLSDMKSFIESIEVEAQPGKKKKNSICV